MKENYKKILETVAWFDVFDFPLTAEEIKRYTGLVNLKIDQNLPDLEYLEYKNSYYFIKDRSELIEKREIANQKTQILWKKVKKWQWLFEITPFIKMTAICNTLAFGNPDEDSDIDLFIITKKNRMFIARSIITFLTSIFGLRRHGNKTKARFCLSFFCTENALNFEKIQIQNGDIYLAYWVSTLRPLFGLDIYKKFLQINQNWVKNYVNCHFNKSSNKNFFKSYKAKNISYRIKNVFEKVLSSKCGDFLEKILKTWQLKRCQEKMLNLSTNASVIVNSDMLKFHNHDKREEYRMEWKKRLNE